MSKKDPPSTSSGVAPLDGYLVVNLAVNLPGPLAASRLGALGARVVKIEPPGGDPLAEIAPAWYRDLCRGVQVLRLDLKSAAGAARLQAILGAADLLLTAMRPSALARLGLDWDSLHARYTELCQVAIVGYPGDQVERPGHDLNYQAQAGLVNPPTLPRTLIADLAGAGLAVSAALGLLLARQRYGVAGYQQVSLAQAAEAFADPLHQGLTLSSGVCGGAFPGYAVYQTRDGWLSLAALEDHFWQRLVKFLGLSPPTADHQALAGAFCQRTTAEWLAIAREQDLPLAPLRQAESAG